MLLPALDDEKEWRDQSLIKSDCYDVTFLSSTAQNLVVSFNSVGAGASQNHIHCHAWVDPPPPLLDNKYAVAKSLTISSFQLRHGVKVSLLDYPCTCIKLSASSRSDHVHQSDQLEVLGCALWRVVEIAQNLKAPHNVAWTNDLGDYSNKSVNIDIYVFFRKSETTDRIESIFRLGASELLGVFHSSSKEQLQSLSNNMKQILSDVSLDGRFVWNLVCAALE